MASNGFSIGMVICLTLTAILFFMATPLVLAYTPPSGNQVDFDGYVYYADGVTPAVGATIFIYYPGDSASLAYQTSTSDSGYYSAGGPNIGKYTFKIRATAGGVNSPDATGMVLNTGDHQQITNNLVIPLSPPAIIYGYVTRGGVPVGADVDIRSIETAVTVGSDSTTGYYRCPIYSYTLHNVNITAFWSSTNIRSPRYHINQVNSGESVRQDIAIPAQNVTIRIRTFNNGAPVSIYDGLSITYGPNSGMRGTDSAGSCNVLMGYYAGQTMTMTATLDGNTLSYTVTPEPDSTVSHDFNFGATPTPTLMPTTVTPTIAATATTTPTVTAGMATNPPAASGTVTPSSEASPNGTAPSTATVSAQPSAEPASTGIPMTYAMIGVGVIVVLLIVVAYLLGSRKK